MDLKDFFQENPKAALAFSGGVDSAYLLWAAMENGAWVRAYYVKSAFQPQFELEDARRLAAELGADMRELNVDVLAGQTIAANPADRCYYCKRTIFAAIAEAAASDGFPVLMDGTNASDDAGDRPGMRALAELSVRSPLRECGLTKDEIRRRSREAGLFTWDKPAYACLATRIPAGTEITQERLRRTEAAEEYLTAIGLRDFRVRMIPANDGGREACRAADGRMPCEAMDVQRKEMPGAAADGGMPCEAMDAQRKGMPGAAADGGMPCEAMNMPQKGMPCKTASGTKAEVPAGDSARLQVRERDIPLVLSRRQEILTELKKYYSAVLLDLEVR